MFHIFKAINQKYKYYKKIYEVEKESNLDIGIYQILQRRRKIYKQHKRAFEIGKRAAQGYNIYLTFGSEKTITKDAKDSYKRYTMAMKHYNQNPCNQDSFILGYKSIKNSEITNSN